MRVNSILLEGPYDPKLYHWTKFSNLEDIFSDNKLEARISKSNYIKWTNKKMVHFTRAPYATFKNDTGAVLVFDRDKIAQNYQIKLRYGDSHKAAQIAAANPEEYLPIIPRREAEEVIERDLVPLDKYLTHLVLFEHNWERLCIQYYAKLRGRPLHGNDLLIANLMTRIIKSKIKVLPVSDLNSNWHYNIEKNAIDISNMSITYFKLIVSNILKNV